MRITGSPKEIAKIADSGNLFKHYFCPDCGTPIYGVRIGPSGVPDEIRAVRAGVFDNIQVLNEWKPKLEIYTEGRVDWGCPVEGAQQFVGMLPAVPE
ncbi:Mss4-like protein [Aspergillus aurantiobrunneus]